MGENANGKSSNSNQQGSGIASPAVNSKKTFPRRGAERNAQKQSSRHSTPVPNSSTNDGTPQPMAPVGPAVVRYPSPKMTIQEMAKRAKQLLDYISRVQIDMADHKSKPASPPEQQAETTTPAFASASAATAATSSDSSTEQGPGAPSAFMLPPPAERTVHTSMVQQPVQEDSDHHDDGRVPDLSRTSMDSTGSAMESALLHESQQDPSSAKPASVMMTNTTTTTHSTGPMSIKVVPMAMQDLSPLLSTPPLSVHDHPLSHHRLEHGHGSTTETDAHEPLTPPHQPLEPSASTTIASDSAPAAVRSMTSLEMMDKLTGDLIRFQEKFGSLHG